MTDFLLLEELLTSEERILKISMQKFTKECILPTISSEFEAATFNRKLISQLADLGIFKINLPTEFGGVNAGYTSYGIICQELEKGDSSVRSLVSVQNSLCIYPILKYGSLKQQQTWLPQMAKGSVIGCFGLTEANAGSDPASLTTSATKVQGGWKLNGTKMWITNATIADLAIVWAKTTDGIRGFLVEKKFKGFTSNLIKHKMSLRASITGELVFNDCFVPDSHYLPKTNIGLKAPLSCLNQARFGIAWGVIGAAIACYECALEYTKTRKQFGKPLARFQLIQQKLVKMINEIVKAQFVNLQLAKLKDANKSNYAMVSLAKMNACQQALSIARDARNLLGANGISLEYPVMRHLQNLEAVFTYEGTDHIHNLIVGKHLTGMDAFL